MAINQKISIFSLLSEWAQTGRLYLYDSIFKENLSVIIVIQYHGLEVLRSMLRVFGQKGHMFKKIRKNN
jgi:hypothetical protein